MRVFKFALPILFVTGLALLAARAWTDQADKAERALLFEHARHHFTQRAGVARAAPDRDRYRDDLRALLRSWFADATDIGNRFPLLRGQPSAFVPQIRGSDVREWRELAESQVGAWREGRVELLDSAAAQGLRLDLLRVAPVAGHLVVDVAVWGAPEEMQQEEAGTRLNVPLLFGNLSLRFFDAKGTVVARLDGGGEPALRLDMPARLVSDAPPGLTLARYELPLFPPDVAQVEWTLAAQVRAPSGETRLAQAVWKTKFDKTWTSGSWPDKAVVESESEAKAAAPGGTEPAAARTAIPKARHAAWPIREQ